MRDLVANERGNVVIVGQTTGKAEGNDADLSFAMSISSEGSIEWYEEWGRDTEEYGWGDNAESIDVDSTGNSFVAGRVSQGVVLDNESVLGSSDGYLLKLNPQGTMQWARYLRIGEDADQGILSGWDDAEDVYVANDSNILVASTFTTQRHDDRYGYAKSLRNYDQDGNLLWENILHNDAGSVGIIDIFSGVDQGSVKVISSYYDGIDKGMDSSNLGNYTNSIYSINLENGDIVQSWDFPDLRLSNVATLPNGEIFALENQSRYFESEVGICDEGPLGLGCWLNSAYLIDLANDNDRIFTYDLSIEQPVVIDDIFWGTSTRSSSGDWPPTITRSIAARDMSGGLLNEITFENYDPQETLIEVQKK